jgi:hypothetical protein
LKPYVHVKILLKGYGPCLIIETSQLEVFSELIAVYSDDDDNNNKYIRAINGKMQNCLMLKQVVSIIAGGRR